MFPYDQFPVSDIRTAKEIEQYGFQSLMRSLNIGRIVAMVGSGLSIKFGQPTWEEFRERAVIVFCIYEIDFFALLMNYLNDSSTGKRKEIDREFYKLVSDYHERMHPLSVEIRELYGLVNSELDASYFVNLCERYFDEVEELDRKHGIRKSFVDGVLYSENINTTNDTSDTPVGKDRNLFKVHAQQQKKLVKMLKRHGEFKDLSFNGVKDKHVLLNVEEKECFEFPPMNAREFRWIFSERFKSLTPTDGAGGSKKQRKKRQLRSMQSLSAQFEATFPKKIFESVESVSIAHSKIRMRKAFDQIDNSIRSETNDVSRQFYRLLGIHRFLTLNYDLEIERMLWEEVRESPLDKFEEFKSFLNHNEKGNLKAGKDSEITTADTIKSASGFSVRSTYSTAKTLADFFTFGAFPTNFDGSVHHLHGRVDDPYNMIVTPQDYQKIYYGNSEQKKSFDEARHAVFTGSDLCVLGMGYSESDVLRPLRDLLEFESNRIDSFGRVYYITHAKPILADNLRDSKKRTLKHAKALAQRLYQEYGIYTLHIDIHQKDTLLISPLRKKYSSSLKIRLIIAAIKQKIQDKSFSNQDLIEIVDYAQSISTENQGSVVSEADLAINIYRYVIYTDQRRRKFDQKRIQQLLNDLISVTVSKDLVSFTMALSEARQNWWEKWLRRPDARIAIYGKHFYNKKSKSTDLTLKPQVALREKFIDSPLVWREANMVSFFGVEPIKFPDKEESPQFTSLWDFTRKAKKEAVRFANDTIRGSAGDKNYNAAAVARVTIPAGGGKGRLVSFFSRPQWLASEDGCKRIVPFTRLFHHQQLDTYYLGMFSVHLTFVLEFSSLIAGLYRFLQQFLDVFEGEAVGATAEDWTRYRNIQLHTPEDRPPAVEVLTDFFDFLVRVAPENGWSNRVVVMISFVDRMADLNGDGYSPIHRTFFKLISGWEQRKRFVALPMDFVFVSANADSPIRYLSRELSYKKLNKTHKQVGGFDAWIVKKKENYALEIWNELEKVSVERVRDEALLFYNLYLINKRHRSDEGGKQELSDERLQALAESRVLEIKRCFGFTKYGENTPPLMPDWVWKQFGKRIVHAYMLAAVISEVWQLAADEIEPASSRSQQGYIDLVQKKFERKWRISLEKLSLGYTRNKSFGYLEELFSFYRLQDQKEIDVPRNSTQRSTTGFSSWERELYLRKNESYESIAYERVAALVLDHMALFAFPISVHTLMACPEVRSAAKAYKNLVPHDSLENIGSDVLLELSYRGFAGRYVKHSSLHKYDETHVKSSKDALDWPQITSILRAQIRRENVVDYAFVLDPKVTAVVRAKAQLAVYGHYNVVPFQTSLYVSQAENSVKPDMRHFIRVSRIVRALTKEPHKQLVEINRKLLKSSTRLTADYRREVRDILEESSEKLRAAYALIRGTFSISVISRLDSADGEELKYRPYDEYRTWIRKSLNNAVLIAQMRKIVGSKDILKSNEPFFREELSWLYNERALVSFIQGRLFDALPLYEQAIRVTGISPRANYKRSTLAPVRRINLNQVIAQLERGHIKTAQTSLEAIVRKTHTRRTGETPSTTNVYARGYLALCYHLSDNYSNARVEYASVISDLRDSKFSRAQCIFQRHYADLLRAMSKSRGDESLFSEAIGQLKDSEELALGIRAVDLYNYSLIARARLNRDRDARKEALEDLRNAEKYARNLGLYKMLAELLKVRGEVLLAEGEATQAGFVTSQSIAMSKRYGMRLRKISAVLVQAQILSIRRQRIDAAKILQEALHESQTLGYATKTSMAMQLLVDHGNPKGMA